MAPDVVQYVTQTAFETVSRLAAAAEIEERERQR
jgi:hypothetical protein